MYCSMPDFPVLCYLLEFAQIHVQWVKMLSNHLILCHPFLLFAFDLSQNQDLFQWHPYMATGKTIALTILLKKKRIKLSDYHCILNLANGKKKISHVKFTFKTNKLITQSCLILCDPVDYNPPGSSVHGILQVRILEWVAISFSRGSSRPRDLP